MKAEKFKTKCIPIKKKSLNAFIFFVPPTWLYDFIFCIINN